jgi:hypothetical protein
MSFLATHLRFALDIKDKYQVSDLSQYLSGTIYPDSRYFTALDRDLTHNEDILVDNWANTDFKKGWQVHQFCDQFHEIARKDIFPKFFSKKDNDHIWLTASALKIIQDMDDRSHFDMQEYLRYLDYFYNANGEDLALVKKYSQLAIDTYTNKKTISLDDYRSYIEAMPLTQEMIAEFMSVTEEYLLNPDILSKIKQIYPRALKMLVDIKK